MKRLIGLNIVVALAAAFAVLAAEKQKHEHDSQEQVHHSHLRYTVDGSLTMQSQEVTE